MNEQNAEFVEIFLQEASEHLQFLREYSGILQDPYPQAQDIERLYISAHTLAGTSASYGFPMFSEVSGKLAHIFQYAMNATIAQDAAGPLVEFIFEGIAALETDLLMISANGIEATEDIGVFKQRYPFAFQGSEQTPPVSDNAAQEQAAPAVAESEAAIPPLPPDGDVPAEILEFFVPEAEEHLQVVTDCLLSLETNPSPTQIHRLLRAMHTVKGSAAQVGLQRIARVAHRAEDLMGRVRDGALRPSAEIVDLCLEAVDALKKFLYRQWSDEDSMQTAVRALFARISRLVPKEQQIEVREAAPTTSSVTEEQSSQSFV
ncbi:MAG TPA: Hpt domain-containing protein, partial [Candidatus Angelobacter sp.]|nr:Hpt domain-containing protein [Candidatus Angelobacter sp.]